MCLKVSAWVRQALVGFAFFSIPALVLAADTKDSLELVGKTNQRAIESQQRIDGIAIETQKMLQKYQQILQRSEYQESYQHQLSQSLLDQQQEIASLRKQLEDIKVTQARIMPLMASMADALEKFVVLDLPFKQQDRVSAVIILKQKIRSSDIALQDKFRSLLEGYQIENEYGRTIDSYREKIVLDGQEISAELLRIGRVGLYYRTLDGESCGFWDMQSQTWQQLPAEYARDISIGIQVAKKQIAPRLLSVPMRKLAQAELSP